MLRRKPSGFPDADFPAVFYLHFGVHGLNGHGHMVHNDTFLAWGLVLEASWPSFKGLETERERILSRGQTLAIVDIGLVLGEHVSSLMILHLEITIRGGLDVLRPVVIAAVVIRFDT